MEEDAKIPQKTWWNDHAIMALTLEITLVTKQEINLDGDHVLPKAPNGVEIIKKQERLKNLLFSDCSWSLKS